MYRESHLYGDPPTTPILGCDTDNKDDDTAEEEEVKTFVSLSLSKINVFDI